jgi:hypothetical protein
MPFLRWQTQCRTQGQRSWVIRRFQTEGEARADFTRLKARNMIEGARTQVRLLHDQELLLETR